jgi:hypothetical protein
MYERPPAVREYFRHAFRWRGGRQRSGYEKMQLLQSPFPLPFDVYLPRFGEGSEIPAHTDPVVAGHHSRCNIVIRCARRVLRASGSSGSAPMPANTASPVSSRERDTF